ncbi:hypothetical protein [Paracoccus versutus]
MIPDLPNLSPDCRRAPAIPAIPPERSPGPLRAGPRPFVGEGSPDKRRGLSSHRDQRIQQRRLDGIAAVPCLAVSPLYSDLAGLPSDILGRGQSIGRVVTRTIHPDGYCPIRQVGRVAKSVLIRRPPRIQPPLQRFGQGKRQAVAGQIRIPVETLGPSAGDLGVSTALGP